MRATRWSPLVGAGALAMQALAQAPEVSAGGGREVVAGARYAAGPLHRFVWGAHYRDLWTTPLVVPVLDLGSFASGLTPLKRGGGQQTKSLRLRGGDGREYAFRSLDKDPSKILPPELVETIAGRILRDQISSGHPAAPLVAAPLLRAAGVLAAEPRLFLMPDDPRLGEFREDFANLLGYLEERPDEGEADREGFAGARKVIGTDRLLARLREDPDERVDARAFLRARLTDVFLGDWDRHEDQWRWARLEDGKNAPWLPIPRDRDQAFCRLDGLLPSLARFFAPQLVGFDEAYPGLVNLTWNGRGLDRRLLTPLSRKDFDEEARALAGRLTDPVIADAVGRMPPEWRRRNGGLLEGRLRARRDRLPEAAAAFFAALAREVEVHGTDQGEDIEIRAAEESVEVAIFDRKKRGERRETFRRLFDPSETREIRVYPNGGDDVVRVSGSVNERLRLRVITGEGHDRVDDSRAGGTRVHTAAGTATVEAGPGTRADSRAYVPPRRVNGRGSPPAPRDWGSAWFPRVTFGFSPGTGLLLGGGAAYRDYGFRRDPFAWQLGLTAGLSTTGGYRLDLDGSLVAEGSRLRADLFARASNLEIVRFFGFGNESGAPREDDFYEVLQRQLRVEVTAALPLGPEATLSLGPVFQHASLIDEEGTFLGATRPFGAGSFAQLGAVARLRVDTRDVPAWPRRGVDLEVGGSFHPGLLDVESGFGEAHARAAAYVPFAGRLQPTLALRVSGKKLWGTYPFHEAAFVGGAQSVRGLPEQRYAGDASVLGSAELRVFLTRFFLVLPGEMGVFALADTGRVFLSGESSSRWHSSFGGGIWFAYLGRPNTISVAVARSESRTALYLRAGLGF